MTDLVKLPADGADDVLRDALECGFTTLLAEAAVADDLDDLGRAELLLLDGDAIVRDGETVGRRIVVADADDQDRVRELAGEVELVCVATEDWTVIPLENMIGWFQGTGTALLAEVDDAEAAKLALGALEVGVDGLVVTATDRATLREIADVRDAQTPGVDLDVATISAIEPVDAGDRVCVDTVRVMTVGDGMLVGSQAGALFFVHSETLDTDYVSSRPFRVNAGPVHAYILTPDGSTRYLSELSAGDEVLVVDAKGRTRPATVGRVKIEERPLLLVEADVGGATASTMIQNAETVALMTPDGPRSVVDLEVGDEVLVRVGEEGRHFGVAVEESIVER